MSRSLILSAGLAGLSTFVVGCSAGNSRSSGLDGGARASFRSSTARSFEVESSEQETLRLIKSHPLDFELQFPEASYAWDRTRAFFMQYTGSFAVEPLPMSASNPPNALAMVVSNRLAVGDPYIYEVQRSMGKKGVRFSIRARARVSSTPASAAKLQAQNLARFVKSGTLDTGITPARTARSS